MPLNVVHWTFKQCFVSDAQSWRLCRKLQNYNYLDSNIVKCYLKVVPSIVTRQQGYSVDVPACYINLFIFLSFETFVNIRHNCTVKPCTQPGQGAFLWLFNCIIFLWLVICSFLICTWPFFHLPSLTLIILSCSLTNMRGSCCDLQRRGQTVCCMRDRFNSKPIVWRCLL